jgi:hypothetical protein
MDLLLILTYAAICYAIFKLFKIPVNAYTLLPPCAECSRSSGYRS